MTGEGLHTKRAVGGTPIAARETGGVLMSAITRVLGPIVLLVGVAACAGTSEESRGATQMQPASSQCRPSGERCRWDDQCCSGRCYVDLGCSG